MTISDLNDDILWTVFQLCAVDWSEGPAKRLTLTRRASQVCRTWRNVLLNSTTIWGNLICMQHNDPHTSAAYLSLVLSRSQSSLLQVFVSLSSSIGQVSSVEAIARQVLFFKTCQMQWNRISLLEVTLHFPANISLDDPISTIRDSKNWTFLTRPAAKLQRLALRMVGNHPGRLDRTSFPQALPISAPVLHTFISTSFDFRVSPHWFSQLRTLSVETINKPRQPNSFHLLMLQALRAMRSLQMLFLPYIPLSDRGFILLEQAGSLPVIEFPYLTFFRVSGQLASAVSLAYAIRSAQALLSISMDVIVTRGDPLHMSSLTRLSEYLQEKVQYDAALNSVPSSRVCLIVGDQSVVIANHEAYPSMAPSISTVGRLTYALKMSWHMQGIQEQDLMDVADVYQFNHFHFYVSTLCLHTSIVQGSRPLLKQSFHLLSPFSSVETLEIELSSLRVITSKITPPTQSSDDQSLLMRKRIAPEDFFPDIKTLRVRKGEAATLHHVIELFEFLLARQHAEMPILVLCVDKDAFDVPQNLALFDYLEGLEILYYDGPIRRRHICRLLQ